MLNKKALAASLSAKETDADFKQTVLLLHGDGTNGAQNNTFSDSSTNAFSITRNGNTTQGTFSPFSQTGWSNYFDGSGDSLTVATASALQFGTGDLTVEFWVYGLASGRQDWFEMPGTNRIQFLFEGTNVGVYINNSFVVGAASTPVLNQWNHVAWTRSSGTNRVFLNGTKLGSDVSNSTNFSDNSVTIGTSSGGTDTKGYFSNVRIIKGTAVYTANFTVPTTALTAITNTSLLTCNSNRFKDDSTNNFTITRNGDTSVQAFSPFAPTDAYSASTNGGSGYFDGSSDYLSIANDTAIDAGTGVFTYECWFYPTAGKNNFLMAANGTGSGFHLAVYGSTTTNLYVSLGRNNVAEDLTTSAGTVIYNAWNHIVAVRNSSNNLGIFINGTRQAYNSSNTNNYGLGGYALTLGTGENNNSTVWMQGYQAGAGVYKSAEYDPTQTSITVPTAPKTGTGAGFLCNFTNAGIIDQTGKNVLETVGNAQIDTGTKKFGTGSIKFDGSGDYLFVSQPVLLDFGTGDFTIEGWFYFNAVNTSGATVLFSTNSTGVLQLGTESNVINLGRNSSSNIISASYTSSSLLNTWTHIAVSRSGSSVRMFVNGTQIGSTATNSDSFDITSFQLGRQGTGSHEFDGYMDDIRISRVARYTANFTAPTKAFADL